MRAWIGRIAWFTFLAVLMAVGVEFYARHQVAKRYGDWILEIDPSWPPSHDPDLGWRSIPNRRDEDNYGPGQHVTFDEHGFRKLDTITATVPDGRYRIICVGDSFTFGAGVGDQQTYPAQLQAEDPRLQTVNQGLGGYGVDQSVLLYERDGVRFEHDLAILAFIDDDFRRMRGKAFQVRAPKPRLLLDDSGAIVLTNSPVPRWGRPAVTRWWEKMPYSTVSYQFISEGLDRKLFQPTYDEMPVASALFARVAERNRKAGRQTVLVYLPGSGDLEEPCDTGFCPRSDRPEIPTQFEAIAKERNILFVDLTPAYREIQEAGPIAPYFLEDGHYSAKGLSVVARELLRELRTKVPGFPPPPTE